MGFEDGLDFGVGGHGVLRTAARAEPVDNDAEGGFRGTGGAVVEGAEIEKERDGGAGVEGAGGVKESGGGGARNEIRNEISAHAAKVAAAAGAGGVAGGLRGTEKWKSEHKAPAMSDLSEFDPVSPAVTAEQRFLSVSCVCCVSLPQLLDSPAHLFFLHACLFQGGSA